MGKRFLKVILQISILFGCLFGYYFFHRYYHFSIPCLFYKVTGLQCPGCGITRCLFSLIEGNVVKAFYYNGLVSIFILPFILYEGIQYYRYISGKSTIKIPSIVWNVLLVIVILFGIVRNIM